MEATELLEYLLSFIKTEYVIIIPVLLGVGFVIKKTEKIADEYIPLFLMLVGIVFSIALGSLTKEPLIHRIIQGVISSFATSWGYEAFTQLKKRK